MLLMLMMLPLPRAAIAGATAATRKYGARTLLANSASNVSVFSSAVGPNHENPALLTSTSTSPCGGQALDAGRLAQVGCGEPGRAACPIDALDYLGTAADIAAVHDDLEAV